MKFLSVAVLLIFLSVSLSQVIELTSDDFDAQISEGTWYHFFFNSILYCLIKLKRVVEFYAPWCHVCSKFASVFQGSASELKGKSGVRFATVNVDQELSLAARFSISHIPTIYLIENSKVLFIFYFFFFFLFFF